jgi:hypothetical protein
MADKDPIDKKAAIFALFAFAFLLVIGFAMLNQVVNFEASPMTSGGGPSAPGQNPKDTPQKK